MADDAVVTEETTEEAEATATEEEGDGQPSDADLEEIARQAERSVSFRAIVKGPQVATNTDSQDCFKVSLSVSGGSLNLYELHQDVRRFANHAVSVTLTPVPAAPTNPHPDQLPLDEGEGADSDLPTEEAQDEDGE